jgi:DMSO/TMAO reductase YedYZ molybdopterin-dependent catalytic subunit
VSLAARYSLVFVVPLLACVVPVSRAQTSLPAAAATTPAAATTASSDAKTTSPETRVVLEIKGDVAKPLSLSVQDLRAMPRKTLKVTNSHEGTEDTYEGVLLSDLLKRAGVASGKDLRGAALATYVVAEASDGYRVVFSIGEIDPDVHDSEIIVADSINGAVAMGANLGPLRLVVPHDKRPARWVRMLQSLTVVKVPQH